MFLTKIQFLPISSSSKFNIELWHSQAEVTKKMTKFKRETFKGSIGCKLSLPPVGILRCVKLRVSCGVLKGFPVSHQIHRDGLLMNTFKSHDKHIRNKIVSSKLFQTRSTSKCTTQF
jgi:hypothetical protein